MGDSLIALLFFYFKKLECVSVCLSVRPQSFVRVAKRGASAPIFVSVTKSENIQKISSKHKNVKILKFEIFDKMGVEEKIINFRAIFRQFQVKCIKPLFCFRGRVPKI